MHHGQLFLRDRVIPNSKFHACGKFGWLFPDATPPPSPPTPPP